MSETLPLDPASMPRAAEALLEHLSMIGVTHLPRVDAPAAIEALCNQVPEWRQAIETNTAAAESGPHVPAVQTNATATHADDPAAANAASATSSRAPSSRATTAPPQRVNVQVAAPADIPVKYALPILQAADRQQRLADAAAQVAACKRCTQLAFGRKNTVFGEGSLTARVAFFGEAPGADEDRQGRPFVGAAGQLLTKMIDACTFKREDVYIFNTVKCRPPMNRNPETLEVENCREFFELQLEVIQPEYIVCLGLVAARALLRTDAAVGHMRGRFHRYKQSKVLVTYHPSYLLRNPEAKRAAWTDLQFLMKDMGIDPKRKQ